MNYFVMSFLISLGLVLILHVYLIINYSLTETFLNYSKYPEIYRKRSKHLIPDLDNAIYSDGITGYNHEVQKNVLPETVLQDKWLSRIDPEFLSMNGLKSKFTDLKSDWSIKGQLTYE